MSRLPDIRPICTCGAYTFPHKVGGGKCNGEDFAEYHWLYHKQDCEFCNLNCGTHCDAQTGAESIVHGQCYRDSEGCGAIELQEEEPNGRY